MRMQVNLFVHSAVGKFGRWLIACLLLVPAAGFAQAAASQSVSPSAPPRKTSKPYTGDLSIFDSPGREQRLHIQQVMEVLGISSGKTLADIGAGGGWFTVRAAERVGSTGTVYAVDINPEAIKYIKARARKQKLSNVKTVLGKADDAQLPANSVDAVLLLKTYHEVADPVSLMRNLGPALRPGAKVGIIDRNGNAESHGVDREIVLREMQQAGYRLADEKDDLVKADEMSYFLIFSVSAK